MEPLIQDGTCMAFTRCGTPEPGEFVAIWFRPEHTPSDGLPQQLKRLAMPLMEGLTFPYAPVSPAECVPLVVVEMVNPPRRWAIPATHIRALHRCLGPVKFSAEGRTMIEVAKLPPEARAFASRQ
jgi:hypothetical protein